VADNEKIDKLQAEIEALRELRKEELSSLSGPDKWNNEQVQKYTAALKELNDELKIHTKAQEESSKADAKSVEDNKELIAGLKARVTALTGIKDKSKDATASFMEMVKEYKDADEEQQVATDNLINSVNEKAKALKEANKALKKAKKGTDGYSAAADEAEKAAEELKEEQEKLNQATGGLSGTIQDVVKDLDIQGRVMNSVKSLTSKFIESTLIMAQANDTARASFNASTGAAGVYDAELASLEIGNRHLGLSMEDHAQSYQGLINGLTGFGVMADDARDKIALLGSKYAKVGVSASDFAGILETSMTMMSMNTAEAKELTKTAFKLAQTLGKDVGAVMSDLNQVLPRLAEYTGNATEMFKGLEEQSQRTGIAVGEIMDIAGSYRTFDSAATAAGNLNAVLGQQLFSTMGLLEAQLEGPSAVLEYMIGNLKASGKDFATLNTFHKEAIANAAGMNVQQLALLMTSKAQTAQDLTRAKELEEAMASGRSLWQEMKIFFSQFAIAVAPLVATITAAFQGLNETLTENRWLMEGIGYAMLAVSGAAAINGLRNLLGVMKLIKTMLMSELAIRTAITALSSPVKLIAAVAGAGFAFGALKQTLGFAAGTDSTPGGLALVGEQGPELLVPPSGGNATMVGANGPEFVMPPQGSAVVNNTTMTALAKQGGGGGNNAQVVAAVRALGAKMDTMITKLGNGGDFVMQVNNREFGRVINEHLGEDGFHPIKLRTA